VALPQFCSMGRSGEKAHADFGSFCATCTSEIPAVQKITSFLDRGGWSQDLLGEYLADKRVQETAKRRLLQSLLHQFPCKAVLIRNHLVDSTRCPHGLRECHLFIFRFHFPIQRGPRG